MIQWRDGTIPGNGMGRVNMMFVVYAYLYRYNADRWEVRGVVVTGDEVTLGDYPSESEARKGLLQVTVNP